MKAQILAAAFLLCPAGVAMAADPGMPMEAPPAVYDWSGAYVGLFGGWAHSRTEATDITGEDFGPPGTTRTLTDNGFFGGVTAGYNFQNGSWVFGPEAELGWVSNHKLEYSATDSDEGLETEYGFYGAVTGRVGYAFDRTLIYGKGGLAFANIDSVGGDYDSGQPDLDDAAIGDDLRVGWTIGAGVEHAITDRWTLKGEYLFADFGSERYDAPEDPGQIPMDFDDYLHTVKIGLNYQF